jgi:hypothetical protein
MQETLSDAQALALRSYAAGEKATIDVWHNRLGHVAPSTIKKLVSIGLATGIEVDGKCEEAIPCSSCVQGKFTRQPFPACEEKGEKVLGLVHIDVCGPCECQHGRDVFTFSPSSIISLGSHGYTC